MASGWAQNGAVSDDDENIWGDQLDDDFLIEATQAVERQQAEEERQQQLSQFTSHNEPTMNPTQAANMYAYRRENLNQTQGSQGVQFATSSTNLNINVDKMYAELATEKNRIKDLTSKLEAATGESANLRRQIDSLKRERGEESMNKWRHERVLNEKHETEKRALSKEIEALRTLLKRRNADSANMASKQAMFSVTRGQGSRLSVGGAGSQSQSPWSNKKNINGAGTSPSTQKYRSDPNLSRNSSQQHNVQSQTGDLHLQTSPASPSPGPASVKVDKYVEADSATAERVQMDATLFEEGDKGTIRLENTESVHSLKILSKRNQIFNKVHGLILGKFKSATPALQHILTKAPKEIMTRFAAGPGIKKSFPDFTDTIFLYGSLDQKKKESADRNEFVEQKYPSFLKSDSLVDLEIVVSKLETLFVYGNTWEALKEIKSQLKTLLQGLQGDARFQLYQKTNLEALWHLLAWIEHLWKFVHFDEECDYTGIKNKYKEELWKKELEEWTGLILKVDYREFYLPELEVIVRDFSLSILESIMTSGYFEEQQKRYEILYCIIKDTLIREHIRNQRLVKKCLTIATWAVPRRKIFNYLCLQTNDGKCLARLFGDNVLKCFKETKSSYDAASLMIHYLTFIESLTFEEPPEYFSSKVVLSRQTCSNGDEPMEMDQMQNEISLDNSTMLTQLADTDKYQYDEGAQQRTERFNSDSTVPCWINPKEWEIPIHFSGEHKPCQCRRVLVGSAFSMLHSVVEMWKVTYVENEERVEKLDIGDHLRLQMLRSDPKQCVEKTLEQGALLQKMQAIREFTGERFNSDIVDTENEAHEITWDEIFNPRKAWFPENVRSDWVEERQRPENILDIILRRGALLMSFCSSHSENLALAIGSEAFNHFTLLEQDFKFFSDSPHITDVEQRLLFEGDDSFNESSGESREASTSIFEDIISIEDSENSLFLLSEFNEKMLLENLPKIKKKL